jgi:non-ribosomal peptide synthase protein (TIGR01720 family)
VKEQLRAVPRRGFGYGVLRYLSEVEEIVADLKALPQPQVSFNYLGQFDQVLDKDSPFGLAPESPGPSRSPKGQRTHLLSINGSITNGQLQMAWTYSEAVHQRETIERVATSFIEALQALIAHCRSPEAKGYTPSDFPDVALSQDEIEGLMLEVGEAV